LREIVDFGGESDFRGCVKNGKLFEALCAEFLPFSIRKNRAPKDARSEKSDF
jgi:hypothetical protein